MTTTDGVTTTDLTGPPPAGGSAAGAYPLDNRHESGEAHLRALADLLDPATRRRITQLCPLAGARCLEVGAGSGSVAVWLADRVGYAGEVVATDLVPDRIPAHPRLTTVGYDLTAGGPWPGELAGPFDLIHARLTLAHLPNRRAVCHELATRLAPDGVLLVEDWAALAGDVVVAAPSVAAAHLYERYQRLAAEEFDTGGTDRTWARRIHPVLLEEGLVDVTTVVHAGYWTAGSPGLRMVAAVSRQLRPRLRMHGMTDGQLDRLARVLADPGLVVHGHPLYATSGRRPAAE